MLKKHMIAELKKHFPNMEVEFCVSTQPFAIIPAIHESWNAIELWDDGDEITVHYGQFTHAHFGYYEGEGSKEQIAQTIADDVIENLKKLFSDKIEFYNFGSGGGQRPVGSQGKLSRMLFGRNGHLWSGKSIN